MSSISMMNFESAIYVNEQLNRLMVNAAQDLAQRSIKACAEHYNFDGEEAQRLLGLLNVKLVRARPVDEKPKKVKVIVAKAAFPMPYNGEFNDACCFALRQNSGLYTQCQAVRKNGDFCKQCKVLADKTEGVPEYGTIQMRQAVGIFEYTDPKGRKPVAYTKVMKKYKIDQEKVLEEAGKFNVQINAEHFVVAEVDSKRGRPSSQKEKAPKEVKGTKGRPKKAKKVLQIEGDDDDLFASLVADANNSSGDEAVIAPKESKKKGKSEEEKEAERLAKEAEKEAKKLALENAKAEKEAKLAAEKLEKEAKKKAEEEARAAKKAAEESEKAEKKAALELAKAEKEAKLAAEKAAKESKTKKPAAAAAKAAKEPEVEDEPDVVKKIEFEGKKYLKSKKSGIIYDYTEYVKNGEQVMVGKWNESKNKIDFNNSGEESEEEYDM
jgi:chemotaxis protein histidine kinase CheA